MVELRTVAPALTVTCRWQVPPQEAAVTAPESQAAVLGELDAQLLFRGCGRPVVAVDGVGHGVEARVPRDAHEVGAEAAHLELGVLEAGNEAVRAVLPSEHSSQRGTGIVPVRVRGRVPPVQVGVGDGGLCDLQGLAPTEEADAVERLAELAGFLGGGTQAPEELGRLPPGH